MRYVFHPEALTEYTEAVQYYAERRVELAQAFIDAVEDSIYRIRESPTRCRIVSEDIPRCLTWKFPYGILYTIEQDYILILARWGWFLAHLIWLGIGGAIASSVNCAFAQITPDGSLPNNSRVTPRAAPELLKEEHKLEVTCSTALRSFLYPLVVAACPNKTLPR